MNTADLPFVVVPTAGHPAQLWVTQPVADWATNCTTGRLYGHLLCRYMEATSDTSMLGKVSEAIVAAGQWTGIEVGFFQAIADEAVG